MASQEKFEKVFQCEACHVRFTLEDTEENLARVKCPRSCTRAPVKDITDYLREKTKKRSKERMEKLAKREKESKKAPEAEVEKKPLLRSRSQGR